MSTKKTTPEEKKPAAKAKPAKAAKTEKPVNPAPASAAPQKNAWSVELIDDKLIAPSPYQTRKTFDAQEIQGLAENILACGLLNPPVIRAVANGGAYEMIAGERRLRAWRLADEVLGPYIPCRVIAVSDAQAAEMVVSENMQRVDLTPLEEAAGIKALLDTGRNQEDVAAVLGRSRAWVSRRANLINLSAYVRDKMAEPESAAARMPVRCLEVLAAYPHEAQDKIVKSWHNMLGSPMELSRAAHWVLSDLDDAEFSTAACAACTARTGAAADLFGDVEGLGLCLKTECYEKKHDEFKASIVDQAMHAFPGKPIFSNSSDFEEIEGVRSLWQDDEFRVKHFDDDYEFGKGDLIGVVINSNNTFKRALLEKRAAPESEDEDAAKARRAERLRLNRISEYAEERLESNPFDPAEYAGLHGIEGLLALLAAVILPGFANDYTSDSVKAQWEMLESTLCDEWLKNEKFREYCNQGLRERLGYVDSEEAFLQAEHIFGEDRKTFLANVEKFMPPED